MKKIAIAILLILLVGLVGYKIYNKPHRSVSDAEGISVNANEIFSLFLNDEKAANEKYLDKTVEVTGRILSLSVNGEQKSVITLDVGDPIFGVNCTIDYTDAKLSVGDTVTVKGFCKGYLSDVVVINCILKK